MPPDVHLKKSFETKGQIKILGLILYVTEWFNTLRSYSLQTASVLPLRT